MVHVGCVEISVLALSFVVDVDVVIIFLWLVRAKVIKKVRQDFRGLVLPQLLPCVMINDSG